MKLYSFLFLLVLFIGCHRENSSTPYRWRYDSVWVDSHNITHYILSGEPKQHSMFVYDTVRSGSMTIYRSMRMTQRANFPWLVSKVKSGSLTLSPDSERNPYEQIRKGDTVIFYLEYPSEYTQGQSNAGEMGFSRLDVKILSSEDFQILSRTIDPLFSIQEQGIREANWRRLISEHSSEIDSLVRYFLKGV